MRISSLFATASIAVAITTSTFVIGGRNAEPILALTSQPVDQPANDSTTNPQPDQTSVPAESQTATPSPSTTQASEPAQPAQTATPSATPTQTPVAVATSHASDVIGYRYGDVQVEVVKLGAEITDVKLLIGDATYGRDAAYLTLIQATIQNQGTNYGNYSGATFTTKAFKQAVENALAKF